MKSFFGRRRAARVERQRREREARDERIRRDVWMLCNAVAGRNVPYPGFQKEAKMSYAGQYVGDLCPGCRWIVTLVDRARGTCGNCRHQLCSPDKDAQRKLGDLAEELAASPNPLPTPTTERSARLQKP